MHQGNRGYGRLIIILIFVSLTIGSGALMLHYVLIESYLGHLSMVQNMKTAFNMLYIFFVLLFLTLFLNTLAKHGIDKGIKHFFIHLQVIKAVKKALLQGNYFVQKTNKSGSPAKQHTKVLLFLSEDYKTARLRISSHIKFEYPLEATCINSCLRHFIVDEQYFSDCKWEMLWKHSAEMMCDLLQSITA
jgi:hypothetical protein